MAAALMSQGKVDAVVVGADRVARNGDTANKIGTLGLAVLAKHFRIPFFVAAPSTSIDLNIQVESECLDLLLVWQWGHCVLYIFQESLW